MNPSRLTFTTSNWDIPQDVEVSAAEDVDAEQDAAVTLRHSASGGGYDNVTGGMIAVTITENPDQVRTKGVTVSPKSLTVMEGGPSRSYTVVLTSEPTERVRITIGGLALAREAEPGRDAHHSELYTEQLGRSSIRDGEGRRRCQRNQL